MTKAEIVAQISRQSGIEKTVVMTVIESFMENVKESMVAETRCSCAGSVALSSNGELKRRPGTFRRIRQLKFPLTISLHSNLPKHF